MKNLITLLSLFFIPLSVWSTCVVEFKASGHDLTKMTKTSDLLIDLHDDGRFFPLKEVLGQLKSPIQYSLQKINHIDEKSDDYDDRYIKYYRYARVLEFLQEQQTTFTANNYQIQTIGKSLDGRDLKVVFPKELDPNKKLIVMFGRHHGDEGTANWIIEGFVNEFFSRSKTLEGYQLVLYPMVNPDGAENRVRYNNNRRDLNRVWGQDSRQSKDEIQFIHQHLNQVVLSSGLTPVITLDMHGSFDEDFIYRVGKRTFGLEYYETQQTFIDELGTLDPWQAANFILSEGNPGMARIRLASLHGWHTLTHETPRDIPLNNRRNRSLQSLKEQGVAALDTIETLY